MRQNPKCWLAQFAPPGLEPCTWILDPVHLVPKRLLKVEFPDRPELLKDERIIRRGCRQHHHHFDYSRKLKIPRKSLPASVEEFATELGRPVEAFLDREYGERLGI